MLLDVNSWFFKILLLNIALIQQSTCLFKLQWAYFFFMTPPPLMFCKCVILPLTLNVPEELHLYGLCVYYVVHICDFGMLRVNLIAKVYLKSHKAVMWSEHLPFPAGHDELSDDTSVLLLLSR